MVLDAFRNSQFLFPFVPDVVMSRLLVCSESHRSGNSIDDNAVAPLTDTGSCSSAGSNDWRLDIRGNNLDCSPPPPEFMDSTQKINQLNEHATPTNTLPLGNGSLGHFNRLIMSDSLYGKAYETRRMPNGLETTEV